MRIVLVSTEAAGGGIASHTETLALGLAKLGHSVLVLVPERGPTPVSDHESTVVLGGGSTQAPEREGLLLPDRGLTSGGGSLRDAQVLPAEGEVRAVAVPAAPMPVGRRHFGQLGRALLYALAVGRACRPLVGKVDLVEVPEWEAAGLFVDRRLPLVVRLHGHLALVRRLNDEPLRLQDCIVSKLEARAARSGALCLAGSAHLAGVTERDFSLAPGKVCVSALGIDTETFVPGSRDLARDAWGIPRHAKVVLFVGRREPRKGLWTLLDAWSTGSVQVDGREAWHQAGGENSLPLLIVAGGDPGGVPDARLLSEARARGIPPGSLRLVGAVGREDLPSLYQASDVVCLPSPAEPFGLTAVEALACGRPVVACAGGGTSEIVEDNCSGTLVAPGDPAALARALGDLLSSSERCRKLGIAGRARVEADFTAEAAALRTIAAYEAVLHETRAFGWPVQSAGIRPGVGN